MENGIYKRNWRKKVILSLKKKCLLVTSKFSLQVSGALLFEELEIPFLENYMTILEGKVRIEGVCIKNIGKEMKKNLNFLSMNYLFQ